MISRISRPRFRHRRRCAAAAAILGVSVLGVTLGAFPQGGTKSGLLFSHRTHVLEYEIECLECHSGAMTSRSGGDDLLAPKVTCAQCHDVDIRDECATCHQEMPPAHRFARVLDYSPGFSHARHLEADSDCQPCHLGVWEKDDPEMGYNLPGMTECMTCHRTENVPLECDPCRSPAEILKPTGHLYDWVHSHQTLANHELERCNDCHSVDECQECHQGDNLFQRTHPANFEFDHALAARGNDLECAACHERTEFCVGCHRENRVVLHPLFDPEWANRTDGGRHKEEAEWDLGNCMACHDDGDRDPVCALCHQE